METRVAHGSCIEEPKSAQKRQKTHPQPMKALPSFHARREQEGAESKLISTLDLSPRVFDVLRKTNIKTLKDVLILTTMDLRNCGLNSAEVDDLFSKTAAAWYHKNVQGFQGEGEFSNPRQLTVGCRLMDELFRGGIVCNQLTELTGAAGTGKTQLCLQLSLTAQLPAEIGGLGGGVLYICTEHFPSKRLKQMLDQWTSSNYPGVDANFLPSMDKIFIANLSALVDVEDFVSGRIRNLLNSTTIKLLILDSVASLFRYDDTTGSINTAARAKQIQTLAMKLITLQQEYGLALICTNQVTDLFRDHTKDLWCSNSHKVVASLGITWANFVSTRVMLNKEYLFKPGTDATSVRRNLEIIFAPHLPRSHCPFEVVQEGIRAVGKVEFL